MTAQFVQVVFSSGYWNADFQIVDQPGTPEACGDERHPRTRVTIVGCRQIRASQRGIIRDETCRPEPRKR
jgi:hypothetical protein